MDKNSRRFQSSRVSDLMTAYFLRGIRSLNGLPTQQALATRRVAPAHPAQPQRERQHPWG
jgi:hypothetical protein